jgi:hypothetical protein
MVFGIFLAALTDETGHHDKNLSPATLHWMNCRHDRWAATQFDGNQKHDQQEHHHTYGQAQNSEVEALKSMLRLRVKKSL